MTLTRRQPPQGGNAGDGLEDVCGRVLRRFNRAYPIPLAITRLDGLDQSIRIDGQEIPRIHPTCQECAHRIACECEWHDTLHAAMTPKMSSCAAENLVSFVPVLRDGKPAAVIQMVEFPRIPKASFQHRIELIARLIEESAPPATASDDEAAKEKPAATVGPWWHPNRNGGHPQIQRAIAHIDQHLADPHTNVASVARALGVNATYLSHIFSEEMGTRMSRYIASRRVALAKRLLATTDWQVKRVAFESGHSNADWFSQVFHAYTGMTPCAYRRHTRANPSEAI